MKRSAFILVFFGLMMALIAPVGAEAALVPFGTQEGTQRFARAGSKADAYLLMNHYRTQLDKLTCGPTSAAIVLNALRYNTQAAPVVPMREDYLNGMPTRKDGTKFDPRLRAYTAESFLNEVANQIKPNAYVYAQQMENGKRDPGLTLSQLARILQEAHQVDVVKFEVGTAQTATNLETKAGLPAEQAKQVLDAIKANLATSGDFVIVNYNRPQLGQEGGGHISPLAAYDEASDSFLILDVNPAGGPWAWVTAADLIGSLNTFDSDAQANRGVLLIRER